MSDASNTWKLIDMDAAVEVGRYVIGHTARYCPPELALSQAVPCRADPALDIWAFGVASSLSSSLSSLLSIFLNFFKSDFER